MDEAVSKRFGSDASSWICCAVNIQKVIAHVVGEPVEQESLIEALLESCLDLNCVHAPDAPDEFKAATTDVMNKLGG
jgi:hypothetical protein